MSIPSTQIIAVATMKGGSGKTTMSVCLAAWWMKHGFRTVLVDADPQRSALRWTKTGTALAQLPVVPLDDDAEPGQRLAALRAEGFERIVVDTPGFRSPTTIPVLEQADLALIPIKASPVDFEVAADTLDLIRKHRGASSARGLLDTRFVLSQTVSRSVIARHMRSELLEAKYALLEAELPNRVTHAEAPFTGTTPTLMAAGSVAAREIAALADEIESILKRRV